MICVPIRHRLLRSRQLCPGTVLKFFYLFINICQRISTFFVIKHDFDTFDSVAIEITLYIFNAIIPTKQFAVIPFQHFFYFIQMPNGRALTYG